MPETTWEVREQGVLLLVDHVPQDYHQWVLIPGWKGSPISVRRDRLGRGTTSMGEEWLLLICNNTDCPARAAYRHRLIEEAVEAVLPVPEPVDAEPDRVHTLPLDGVHTPE